MGTLLNLYRCLCQTSLKMLGHGGSYISIVQVWSRDPGGRSLRPFQGIHAGKTIFSNTKRLSAFFALTLSWVLQQQIQRIHGMWWQCIMLTTSGTYAHIFLCFLAFSKVVRHKYIHFQKWVECILSTFMFLAIAIFGNICYNLHNFIIIQWIHLVFKERERECFKHWQDELFKSKRLGAPGGSDG